MSKITAHYCQAYLSKAAVHFLKRPVVAFAFETMHTEYCRASLSIYWMGPTMHENAFVVRAEPDPQPHLHPATAAY